MAVNLEAHRTDEKGDWNSAFYESRELWHEDHKGQNKTSPDEWETREVEPCMIRGDFESFEELIHWYNNLETPEECRLGSAIKLFGW